MDFEVYADADTRTCYVNFGSGVFLALSDVVAPHFRLTLPSTAEVMVLESALDESLYQEGYDEGYSTVQNELDDYDSEEYERGYKDGRDASGGSGE